VDEAAWNDCRLLYELLALVRPRMNDRQRRLFAVACCGRFARQMADARSRDALEVARRFADGEASEEARFAAEADASEAYVAVRDSRLSLEPGLPWSRQAELLAQAALLCVTPGVYYAEDAADCVRWALLAANGWGCEQAEETEQCRLLREIVGPLPFHQASVDPLWLAYNDGAAAQLAALIEREQDFDVMPILADALEEAGCADERLLSHCRDRGGHARGCWAIDLLLGRAGPR
jgi:hypothetical protein